MKQRFGAKLVVFFARSRYLIAVNPRSEPAIFGLTAKIKSTANDQFVDEAADRFSRRGAMPQVRARTLSVNLALDDPPQHCSDPIAAA